MPNPTSPSDVPRFGGLWCQPGARRLGYLLLAAVILGFYLLPSSFGQGGNLSALHWLWNACNAAETDYLHGRFVPLAMGVLIYLRRHEIASAAVAPRNIGLLGVALGLFLYVLAFRTLQPRLAILALPPILFGAAVFLWGFAVARRLAFPICLIFFAIPLPNLLQATAKLQVVATQTAYHLSSLLGAQVTVAGNIIKSASGAWDFDIAEGCSGIRSLVALTLIAAIYGHLTQDRLWKKLLLFALSVPIALLANGVRVTTVVLIAEYFDADFAAHAYHTYSGLLFIPVGLAALVVADMAINRRLPFSVRRWERRTVVRRADGHPSSTR